MRNERLWRALGQTLMANLEIKKKAPKGCHGIRQCTYSQPAMLS